jgi:hypothetical protein
MRGGTCGEREEGLALKRVSLLPVTSLAAGRLGGSVGGSGGAPASASSFRAVQALELPASRPPQQHSQQEHQLEQEEQEQEGRDAALIGSGRPGRLGRLVATSVFAGSYRIEGATREMLEEMGDPADIGQRVTGLLATALRGQGGVTQLAHVLAHRCTSELTLAGRPRSALIVQLHAAAVYVRDGAWECAEGLLVGMLPRVLADGWPSVIDSLYSLLMQCFDGSGSGGGGGRTEESIALCLLVAASSKASSHSRSAAAARLAQLARQLEHQVVYPMQALNEAVYDKQGVGERERLELSDGTRLWRMVCTQPMRVLSTVLQASLTLPLTSAEEEGDAEAMLPHPPPPGGDSGEEEEEEEEEGGGGEKGKGACVRSCESGRGVAAEVEAEETEADDTVSIDDTVMIDLGDGIILTSKRVPVPAGFCDDEREEAAEGKEEEADGGGGARLHPS